MSEQPTEEDLDLDAAEDTTEDDGAVQDPGPSPYADPDQETDQPQDDTP